MMQLQLLSSNDEESLTTHYSIHKKTKEQQTHQGENEAAAEEK